MAGTTTKSVDARGRLTLGREFANRQVIITVLEDGIVQLIPAKVVPAREAWLYKNPQALAAVTEGLEKANKQEFAEAPELDCDSD